MSAAGNGRPRSAWSTAAVIVAIISVGTLIAGLTHNPESRALLVPGCDEVIQPQELQRINFAFVVDDASSNPDLSWFTAAKATSMSNALNQALPAGTTTGEGVSELSFGPIEASPFGEVTTAFGPISLGGITGGLTVDVGRVEEGPGPCIAGSVDERRTLADGTTVETFESESNSRATAYAPDGSRIEVFTDTVLTLDQLLDIAAAPGLRTT